jgi:hypothetical protein
LLAIKAGASDELAEAIRKVHSGGLFGFPFDITGGLSQVPGAFGKRKELPQFGNAS